MPARLSARRVWAAIEDWLNPTLRLSTHERALYYHLLHRTRLAGRRSLLLSRRRAAEVTGLSTGTARHYLCVLAEKGCIRFLDRGQRGSLLEVRLPQEIACAWSAPTRLPRATSKGRRLAVPPASDRRLHSARRGGLQPAIPVRSAGPSGRRNVEPPPAALPAERPLDRNAAGQPRAWPRNQPLRQRELRGVIFRRARGRCFYCRRRIRRAQWTLDHIVPITRGGSDAPQNLVACCHQCNSTKNAMPAAVFLRSLARRGVISPPSLRLSLSRLRRLRA